MKQKKKQRKVKGRNPFLPQEIITNILKRLPVKSLIRFKCVCKHWENLIKTPSFIGEHLHHASNQNPCLLFGELSPYWSLQLYLLGNEMKILEVHCDSMFDIQRYCGIIGSSNGLLCVKHIDSSHSHPILLWNPAIRQVRLVPKPVNSLASDFFFSGFGFSSIVSDYKILTLDGSIPDFQGQVYSLKTGSWKKVESSPLKGVVVLPGSFAANGSIFWVGFKHNEDGDGKVHVLVSYDMAVEVFTLILSPIQEEYAVTSRLIIHKNKLAIVSQTSTGSPISFLIDLWVMEDGTGKSGERWAWTKKFSIRHPFLSVAGTVWRNEMVCRPSCVGATEGETLDAEGKSIAFLNLTTNEVKMFAICKYGRPYPLLNYVESLVPVSQDHIEEL